MIKARWNIFKGLQAWRAAKYDKCVSLLYAGIAELDSTGRAVSPGLRLKLLMACAITGNSGAALSQLDAIEVAILGNNTLSDHDKNYLFLVVEAACQRLRLPTSRQTAIASRTEYRVTNRLLETYPIGLLLPDSSEG